jgi:hypothetical protein
MTRYTVKLEKLRVIAWCVQRDSENGGIFMSPITLALDPREQHESEYLWITTDKNNSLEDAIRPHTVMSIVPSAATLQVRAVLCDKDGKELHRTVARGERVECPLGFETIGSGHEDVFEQWRKEAEENPEELFLWYFDDLRWVKEQANEQEADEPVDQG